jgi:hypothetical protein
MNRVFLLTTCLLLLAAQAPETGLSGMWHYGIDRNQEYMVRITHSGQHVRAEYLIRDPASGAEHVYAVARGVKRSFWDCYLEGEYIAGCRHVAKGTRFRELWLIYDKENRIQTLSYWGVHRIKHYLVREGSPETTEP